MAAPAVEPPRQRTRAALGAGLACLPIAEHATSSTAADVHRWKRESRWTASPVAIHCKAELAPPAAALSLVISGELPHAREVVVFRVVLRTTDGSKITHHGAVALEGERTATVALPGENVRAVRLRLAPAYLPYLNLRELSARESRSVGE